VDDDGRGIDFQAVENVARAKGLISGGDKKSKQELLKLIFQPGFSTAGKVSAISGRGIGLSVVREQVRRLMGKADVLEKDTPGASILLSLPLSISMQHVLLVSAAGQVFGIPTYAVERLLRVEWKDIVRAQGKPVIQHGGKALPVATLSGLLALSDSAARPPGKFAQVALLRSGEVLGAIVVETFLDERHALLHELSPPECFASFTGGGLLLDDGTVAIILNPDELLDRIESHGDLPASAPLPPAVEARRPTILVVDDSVTTRSLEKNILQTNGYNVKLATDGVEALELLRTESVDLVISDLHMPRLDGFGLLEEMKRDPALAKIPFIIVSSLETQEEQARGLALGADAYIVKRKFDQRDLLDTVRQIV
jgi:two-component system chemotaxis sensor kinase CheA